jgi:hypothetical protein
MVYRSGLSAVLALFTWVLLAPAARGQDVSPQEREEVLALSRRIDAYIARRCQEAGVSLAPLAEDSVYFRRLHLDLAGRIPTLNDVHDFLDNPDPDKRWQWVERLLADDAYARHMGAVWRTNILGNVTNQQFRFLTPSFETWLREQMQKNVGLDAMTRAILTTNAQAQNAFGRGMAQNSSPAAFYFGNENKAENLAGATSRAFLGIKLDCAQCHAHPFASWSRDQFWEFAAFFSNLPAINGRPVAVVGNGGREIRIPNTDKVVKAKFLSGEEPKWQPQSESRKVLAEWVTTRENPYFARAMADHVWTYLMGTSLLEPIQEPGNDARIAHPELLDELAQGLATHKFDMKFLLRAILHSGAYQRSSAGKGSPEEFQLFARRAVRGLAPEQIYDSIAEATEHRDPNSGPVNPELAVFGNQARTPRSELLSKFQAQDFRDEPQTSILQALFLMNGKFLTERTKLDNNGALQVLAQQPTSSAKKVETLYMMVLSRPPRPEEAARLVRYIDSGGPSGNTGQALSDAYWALLNSAEFLLNH